jgi:hypothetical protein
MTNQREIEELLVFTLTIGQTDVKHSLFFNNNNKSTREIKKKKKKKNKNEKKIQRIRNNSTNLEHNTQ